MNYQRYHISCEACPDVAPYPNRFKVRVIRWRLAQLLLRELFHYRFNLPVVTSRPCVYGTFSGPIGGFAPRPSQCVGCLRCTLEYPDMVRVRPNPARRGLGDSYFTPDKVDTVVQEAATGQIPVRGAGYRGAFGGEGWDGMWTDMSEIVRPTRDGIHGREFISTSVDLGERPGVLTFDGAGVPSAPLPESFSLPIPMLFDAPPLSLEDPILCRVLAEAAGRLQHPGAAPGPRHLRDARSLRLDERPHRFQRSLPALAASLAPIPYHPGPLRQWVKPSSILCRCVPLARLFDSESRSTPTCASTSLAAIPALGQSTFRPDPPSQTSSANSESSNPKSSPSASTANSLNETLSSTTATMSPYPDAAPASPRPCPPRRPAHRGARCSRECPPPSGDC